MARTNRRDFLCDCGKLSAAAIAIGRFGMMNALAQAGDYKALVCIFLNGGSDTDNVIIPVDNYAMYAAGRAGTGLQLPQTALLQIGPSAGQFGLHPSLSGLKEMWDVSKLAVVCNTGPLVEPTTRQTYLNRTVERPRNLFSHSDQQAQWQTCVSDAVSSTGWGGRTADRMAAFNPPEARFPMEVTVAGVTIFTTGETPAGRPLAFPPGTQFRLEGFPNPPDSDVRYATMLQQYQSDITSPTTPTLVRGASETVVRAIENSQAVATLPPITTVFPNTSLGNQMRQVALLIKLNQLTLGLRRQIFFCSLGGFDTHNNQVAADPLAGTHAALLSQLSGAMRAFYSATEELAVASQVTTFTLTDFGRTFKPNSGLGTDHAWGSHHFVMGGAVNGGDFYGQYPELALNGPNDADSGSGARGRWIPTSAVDQYAATLATWYGVGAADLPYVFPNLHRFPTSNLGFLSS